MDALHERILRRNAWRLLPLLTVAYVINYLDRTNVSFAALTMNKDLGLTATQYGRGAGIFFPIACSSCPATLPSTASARGCGSPAS